MYELDSSFCCLYIFLAPLLLFERTLAMTVRTAEEKEGKKIR